MSNNGKVIGNIFETQKKYKSKSPYPSYKERKEKLQKLLKEIISNSKEIENAVYADFKKPHEETRLTEIFAVTTEIKHVLKNLKSWMKPRKVKTPLTFIGADSELIFEPRGTCLIISPFNYPLQLAVSPIVAALAAGCSVILKPSEKAGNTSAFLKKSLNGLFDKKELFVIEGDKEVAQELLKLPFDHIFYTGGQAVGKKVMAAASKNLSSVTLEMGGKSPTIVDETSNLKEAAERIIWGKFINAGQTCIAPDYLLVHKNAIDEFTDKLNDALKKLYGDQENISENKNYCRLIDNTHFNKAKKLYDDAVKNGAKVVSGGGFNREEKFVAPTIMKNISMDMLVMREEIFSPILPVITYTQIDDIKKIVSNNPKPLALYIFSDNKLFIDDIKYAIAAGSVMINDVVLQFGNMNLPFGGVSNSGIGKTHGFYGFKEFSNEKSIMRQNRFSITKMLYPPYTKRVGKLIDYIVKYF